jgi:Ser/Thr protein kinase RdoA (MazF antagonist)
MLRSTPDVLTAESLRFAPPQLPLSLLHAFLEKRWGISGTLEPLIGERDQNCRVTTQDGRRFVLKVSGLLEDPALVDFQVKALQHIAATDPDVPVPRLFPSLADAVVETLAPDGADKHAVRLLSYLDGRPLGQFPPPNKTTLRHIGALQGRLCHALATFSHPAASHFMPWDSLNGLVVSPQLRATPMPAALARRCAPVLDRLEHESLDKLRALPAQVIHNDGHSGNVLCDPENPEQITGVIDFGDMTERSLVVDLATSLTSVMEDSSDALGDSAALVAGFEEFMPLPDAERKLLFDAVLARAILVVELLTFRMQHDKALVPVLTEALDDATRGLEAALAIDPRQFLEAISR